VSGVNVTAAEIVSAAIDWFEWEAAHAPDGGPDDPRDWRLYQLLADPEVRQRLRAGRQEPA
jgi:hypothetical protein